MIFKGAYMKQNLIFQSDSIICGRYKLGVNEMKIVLNFINLIEKEDSDFWTYSIPAKSFNIEHKKLKYSAKALMNKPALEIEKEYNPNLAKDKQEWLFAHWFSDIEYKNGCIEASFSPKLKPYFLALKTNFTAYNLQYILPMQSQYSMRLYQLLKSEQWKKNTVTYSIEYLRDIFQLKDKYKLYGDFKKKVIQQAEKELKEHSDIYFKYSEVKDGRKVIEITFNIFNNKNNQVFEINKTVSSFKKKIYEQYINKEIIVYKAQTYKCDSKGYLTLNDMKIEPEKAITIWQYIYNNQGNLITSSFDYDDNFEMPDIGSDTNISTDREVPDIGFSKELSLINENTKLSPINEDFKMTFEMKMYAGANFIEDNQAEQMFEEFKIYYQAKGTEYKDWEKSWQLWVNRSKKYVNHLPTQAIKENMELSEKMKEVSSKHIKNEDLEIEFIKFKNHYISNGLKSNNWTKLWENWSINHKQFKPKEQSSAMKEKQEYRWEFRKLKDTSDKIEQWLDFTVGIDFIKLYVIPGIKEFEIKTKQDIIKLGWQYIMHPDYNTRQLLLFRIESDLGQALLEHRDEDIIDIEIL
jgi:plasmid replication initiation protein